MKVGIQLPNHTRSLSDLDIQRLQALQPTVLRAFHYVTAEQLRQVEAVVGTPTLIISHPLTGEIDPDAWAQELIAAANLAEGLGFEVWLAPVNEPNHQDGPYADPSTWARLASAYCALVAQIKAVLPLTLLISPNLAVMQNDLRMAREFWDSFGRHDFIGVNSYWQYDNHVSGDWGLRIDQFRTIYNDKRFVVLEMGDSTPGRPSEERAARIALTLQEMERLGYVEAASIFILGYDEEAPQTWPDFVYAPEDLAMIRSAMNPPADIRTLAQNLAAEHDIPWDLAERWISWESGWNPQAVSREGAEGLLQLMPQFYPDIDRFDPAQNLNAGMHSYKRYLERYEGSEAKALVAYNWGPGNLDKALERFGDDWWLALPPETVRYIKGVVYNA